MKKFTYLATMLLVMAGVASCKKNAEVKQQEYQGKMIPISVTADQSVKKTTAGAGGQLVWSAGDKITVITQDGLYSATLTLKAGEEGKSTGEFDGEISENVPNGAALYGLYGVTYDSGVFTANVPAEQTYADGSFMPGAFPSVGTGTYVKNGATSINFPTNPMGILRVTVKGASDEILTSVSIKSNNATKKIAGAFTLTAGTWIVSGGETSEIVMNCSGDDLELSSTGVQLNIVVPPFTFEKEELRVTAVVTKNGTAGKLYAEVNTETVAVTANDVTNIERTVFFVKDVQDHWYDVCKINGDYWMAENLRCNVYDTDSETKGTIPSGMTGEATPHYTDASDKSNWVEQSTYADNLTEAQVAKFGYLYNWAAAIGIEDGYNPPAPFTGSRQGICPNGWHVPSCADWSELANYIDGNDGQSDAGAKVKTTSGWYSGEGYDTYGFAALPAGGAASYGMIWVGKEGYFQTTEKHDFWAYNNTRYLADNTTGLKTGASARSDGYSVRCLKNK